MAGHELFLYGTLRDPALLAVVLGEAPGPLEPARLPGHAAMQVAGDSYPVIVADPCATADGLLLRGVGPMALARLDFYECGFGYHRAPGQVEGPDGPATAQVYWPDGSLPLSGKAWHLAEWQAADGGLSVEVAREWMAHFGQIRATDVAWRYPQMRRRAHTRRMAAEHVPPRGPGTALARADLKDHQRREVWGGFFTIEEHDLAVPLLEGGPPRPMRRAVFVSSDAAIVLPYDPARDRVLLIEQFRAGPLARNDPAPWILEPVAGLVDPGETPEETAFRETAEEAGVTPRELIEIARYYPSPGASTEYFHSYLGLCDLPDGVEGHHGVEDEGEDIRTHLMSFDAAMAAVAAGTIRTGPLILALHWLAGRRAALRGSA